MEAPDTGPPVVALPERVDRHVRLGPFPSARDAVKFACYAAIGAVIAPFATPWAWVPFLAVGFGLSVGRLDGEAVDERVARWLLWELQRPREGRMTRAGSSAPLRGRVARLRGGGRVAVVRTGGTPLAYRPPEELEGLFDRFRELLRVADGPLFVRSTTIPLPDAPLLPDRREEGEVDRAACEGYRELVSVLCRRRRRRRVEISIGTTAVGAEGRVRLEERVVSLLERLSELGVRPVRLRDRALADSLRAFGWEAEGEPD